MDSATKALLIKTHGRGKCPICSKPKASEGEGYCSYPHMRIAVGPADPENPNGFLAWERIKEDSANG